MAQKPVEEMLSGRDSCAVTGNAIRILDALMSQYQACKDYFEVMK